MIQISVLYDYFRKSNGVVTDSRMVTEGTIFFALKGDKFDGNEFAEKALASGAKYVVVDRPVVEGDKVLLVDNVLETLQKLAAYHRSHFDIPVVGITGSCGKTTTKELVKSVLSSTYNVIATKDNFNNHIGVPMTLLDIDEKTQIAVVEMGASAPGEIESLVKLVQPTCGIVTNVEKAHIEGFGSFDAVKKTKGELYDYLRQKGQTVFFNADNAVLQSMVATRAGLCTVKYGVEYQGIEVVPPTADEPYLKVSLPIAYSTARFKNNGDFSFVDKKDINDSTRTRVVNTKFIGDYNADNILAALCIGQHFEVPLKKAVKAIEAYVPANNRSQMVDTGRNKVIVDAYNANPASMKASLDNFARTHFERIALILGDMKELGSISMDEHIGVVKKAMSICASSSESVIFLVGENMVNAVRSALIPYLNTNVFNTVEDLIEYLEEHPLEGKVILVKGSHSTSLEKVIPYL